MVLESNIAVKLNDEELKKNVEGEVNFYYSKYIHNINANIESLLI